MLLTLILISSIEAKEPSEYDVMLMHKRSKEECIFALEESMKAIKKRNEEIHDLKTQIRILEAEIELEKVKRKNAN